MCINVLQYRQAGPPSDNRIKGLCSALIHTTAWTYIAVAPPILMLPSPHFVHPIPFDFFYFKNTSFVPGCAFSLLPLRPDISLRGLRGRRHILGGVKGRQDEHKEFYKPRTHTYGNTRIQRHPHTSQDINYKK